MDKMMIRLQGWVITLGTVCLLLVATKAEAFALLGPIQPWMQESNGVILPGDIGGPMNIGEGYRWNVPVVTYGFDQSFVSFFGTNGVAAVTSAIQILNNLPPASQNSPTNYPFNSSAQNGEAFTNQLYDMKSATLPLLLEHLGLASPTRYVYVFSQWDSYFVTHTGVEVYNFSDNSLLPPVVERNFDPLTLFPSQYVNTNLCAGITVYQNHQIEIIPQSVDPFGNLNTTVADDTAGQGNYYTNLTYDDVGGLHYLYNTNQIAYETLLPGVIGAGTNASSYANGAFRQGVDKITFMPQPVDPQSGVFLPTTNFFTETYLTNGVLVQQQMARTIAQPDFLFSAADITNNGPWPPMLYHSGTTNWINNGTANAEGPGVIQPPVDIVFNKFMKVLQGPNNNTVYPPPYPDEHVSDYSGYWGSFNGSTNPPIEFTIPQTITNQLAVRMWLTFLGKSQQRFDWIPSPTAGTTFAFQTSTNLTDWVNLFTVTNNSGVTTYECQNPSSTNRFYRLAPQ